MSKKVILFDWDDTLFSKKLYKWNLLSSLAKICKVSIEQTIAVDNGVVTVTKLDELLVI